MLRAVGWGHSVALGEIEPARLPPRIESDRVVGTSLERVAPGEIRVPVEVAIVFASELDIFASFSVDERVGAFLKLLVPTRTGGDVEARWAAADQCGPGDVPVDVAVVTALAGSGDVRINAGGGGHD